jgi:hypothetical protein
MIKKRKQEKIFRGLLITTSSEFWVVVSPNCFNFTTGKKIICITFTVEKEYLEFMPFEKTILKKMNLNSIHWMKRVF